MLLLTIRILYMKKPENRFLIRSYPKDQLMESHAWPMVLSSTYRSWAMVLLSTSSGFFFLFFSFMIRIIKEILFIIGNYALSSIPLSLQRLVFSLLYWWCWRSIIFWFLNSGTSEINLFYNLQLFYWHFLEILWLFIFLIFYSSCY